MAFVLVQVVASGPTGALHCPACGATTTEKLAEGIDLYWGRKAPVIGSSIVVKQLLFVFGAGFLFVFLIMVLADPSSATGVFPVLFVLFLFFIALSLIVAAALQFFTKGGLYTEFAVTRQGIGYKAGDESRTLNTATLGGSAIGFSLSGTGGSLINITREMDFMAWNEIRSATAYRRDNPSFSSGKSW